MVTSSSESELWAALAASGSSIYLVGFDTCFDVICVCVHQIVDVCVSVILYLVFAMFVFVYVVTLELLFPSAPHLHKVCLARWFFHSAILLL